MSMTMAGGLKMGLNPHIKKLKKTKGKTKDIKGQKKRHKKAKHRKNKKIKKKKEPKRIIAITGMPGAGKTEVRKIIEKKSVPVIVMRHVVEDEMRKKKIEPNNKNLRDYADKLRKKHGYDIVAKKCVPLIKEKFKKSSTVLIDGIRGPQEVALFKKQFGQRFVLISILAAPKTRFERLKKRGLPWDMKTRKEFDWRDKREISWGLGDVIKKADYIIDNEGTKKDLRKKLGRVFSKLAL